jgi:hypothetical protein
MIKYIQRNKEWIFSGCGVVLLLFVGQFIWSHLPTHQKSPPTPVLASSPRSQSPESSPPVAATPSTFVTPIPSSPVTFAEIVRVESDNTLTSLQKDEFRRKHEGKIVEWTVRVLSVQRQWEHQADSDFLVVFGSSEAPDIKSSRLGETGVATFPASLRGDMVDLHSGDIIRFRGVLQFIGPIHYIVAVNNCQLLEHHK